MTTVTLSSRQRFGSLLGRMLRRNLSTSIYLFVIIFVFFPLQMFFETRRELDYIAKNGSQSWTDIAGASLMYTSVSAICMVGILLMASLSIALVQCSYLHNKRAVDLYHSLPVTRTQIMLAGTISSFVTIAVPYVVNYLMNLAVSVYRVRSIANMGSVGSFEPQTIPFGEVAWDMFGWLVTVFAIIAIVNLVATQVGSVFENFVFVCELLIAPALVFLLNNELYQRFLTGYIDGIDPQMMFSITPATFMIGRLNESQNPGFYNGITILWLILGVVALWAAVWLYRRRRSEIAETSGCRGVLGVLFSTIAVYLAAPLAGMAIFYSLGSDNRRIYVVGVVLGAVLSFLLIEAILNRGFAGIRAHLPRGGAVCAFVIAVSLVVTNGGLGFETRLPDVNKVDSVILNNRGWYEYAKEVEPDLTSRTPVAAFDYYNHLTTVTLTDKQAIEKVIAMHERVIPSNQNPSVETDYWGTYSITYNLGGKELKRRYDRTNREADALMNQLEDTEAFQRAANPVLRVNPDIVSKAVLHDNLGFKSSEVTTKSEITALLEALGKDSLEQGTAPYIGGEQVLCYIFFETPYVNRFHKTLVADEAEPYIPQPQHFNSFSMPVFASYKHTLAQLGSNLPAKGSASDITQIGLGVGFYDYYNSNRNDRFVSRVTDVRERDYVKGDIEAYTQLPEQIVYAVENMINTAIIGRPDDTLIPMYCTLYKGNEVGITVMLDVNLLPSNYLDEFPSFKERYQAMKDDQVSQPVVVKEVTMVNS